VDQETTEEKYKAYISNLKKPNLSKVENEVVEKFCDGAACEIPLVEQ